MTALLTKPISRKKNKKAQRPLSSELKMAVFKYWNIAKHCQWQKEHPNELKLTSHKLKLDSRILGFDNEILASDGIHHHWWPSSTRPCLKFPVSLLPPFLV